MREALREHPEVSVDQADGLPSGSGVVGVLVPPEIAVGEAALAALPDLRIVAATATGYDHLDLAAISAAGAWATHCPGYCTEEVAEHAIAFALDLLRGVTLLDRSVHAGAWDLHQAAPRRVSGAVLGIVGLGRIGREVARRAQALEMRVLGFDPVVSPGSSRRNRATRARDRAGAGRCRDPSRTAHPGPAAADRRRGAGGDAAGRLPDQLRSGRARRPGRARGGTRTQADSEDARSTCSRTSRRPPTSPSCAGRAR